MDDMEGVLLLVKVLSRCEVMSRTGGPENIPVMIGRDIPGRGGSDVKEGNPEGIREAKEDMAGNPGRGGKVKPFSSSLMTATMFSFFPSTTINLFRRTLISFFISSTLLSDCLAAIQFSCAFFSAAKYAALRLISWSSSSLFSMLSWLLVISSSLVTDASF